MNDEGFNISKNQSFGACVKKSAKIQKNIPNLILGRFLSSGKMNQNAKMNFILAFFISTFATLSC
jgi:hypothetical protein